MNNKLTIDLTQYEVELLISSFVALYPEIIDYFTQTDNSLKLEQVNKLFEKIDNFILNNP